MRKFLLLFILTCTLEYSVGQNLYKEKFDNCSLAQFCLDCGDVKAQPPQSFIQELSKKLDSASLKSIQGVLEFQILIDSLGKVCLLSVDNKTNIQSSTLKLQNAVTNSTYWKPARSNNKDISSSVSVILEFANGGFTAKRRVFDFKNLTNEKTTGTPEVKGTDRNKLSETWTVYTQENSALPWDMTRAVVNDLENNIWIGTDNGIVKISNNEWKVFNSKNSIIKATKYDKNLTQTVRDAEVDKKNNKWFVIGYDVYRYDNQKWTMYDSTNSPIDWARKIFVDRANNVWFTSWDGVAKFDGNKWSILNTKNSALPSDKALGVYVDSKNRLWIGTFEGNIMIEGQKVTKFAEAESPLSKAYISQGYETNNGDLWFSLYKEKDMNAGMYIMHPNGSWERIKTDNDKMFYENSINNFLLDEDKNVLWVSLNNVGILRYDLINKAWEVYTTENSNVPSVNVEKITKDKNGAIWAATYAGVIKLNIK
jgi:ligand-binding sensor domain-containing protein